MSRTLNYLYSTISGAIAVFGFAPYACWPLTLLAFAFLFYQWLATDSWRVAVWHGLCFGLGFFGFGVSWVFVSIHVFGYTSASLAGLLTFGFIVVLASFFALQAAVLRILLWYWPRHQLFCLACSQLCQEALRSVVATGFPWLLLGYSQLEGPLVSLAPLVSVYGISFLVAGLAAVYATASQRRYIVTLLAMLSVFALGAACQKLSWGQPGARHRVSLIQGNIRPDDKFLLAAPLQTVWQHYVTPSVTAACKASEFIVWPENSLPLASNTILPFLQQLQRIFQQRQQSLILGMPRGEAGQYYVAMMSLGLHQGSYDKHHLVPFGEYVPWEKWLRGAINFFDLPMSDFRPGPARQAAWQWQETSMLPLVCYEVVLARYVQQRLRSSPATVLVTVSEDGWFGNSYGPHQHLEIARMRAIETARYVVRATSSGISAIINARGQVVVRGPQFLPYVLHGEYVDYTGNTPWVTAGEWYLGCLVVTGFFLERGISLLRKNTKSSKNTKEYLHV
jgi:apolipoprotein N-acyltransferase